MSLGIYDVLIVEPTLAACASALELTRRGLQVAMIAGGTSLGYEYANCLQGWIKKKEVDDLPDPYDKLFAGAMNGRGPDDYAELHLGRWTEGMEDLLLDAGVDIFYGAHAAAGLMDEDDQIAGALVGGKFGLNALRASAIVDASFDAVLARCMKVRFAERRIDRQVFVSYSMMIQQGKDSGKGAEEKVKSRLTPHGELIRHGRYLELRTEVEFDPTQPLSRAELALNIRRRALGALNCKEWSGSNENLLIGPDSTHTEPVLRLDKRKDGTVREADYAAANGSSVLEISACPDHPGLYVLGGNADLPDSQARRLNDPAIPSTAIRFGTLLGQMIDAAGKDTCRGKSKKLTVALAPVEAAKKVTIENTNFNDPGYFVPGMARLTVFFPEIPVIRETDLLIAGLGTSGYTAACEAAERGMDHIAVEQFGDVGGIHTVGGVPTYWFGYHSVFFQRFDAAWRADMEELKLPRALAMLKTACEKNTSMLLHTGAVGVKSNDSRVAHLFVTCTCGLAALGGKNFIDASGDGDIAAWAGASHEYGRGEDEMTMWCSFGKFQDYRPAASRQYNDVADCRSATDITRSIIAGRRRKGIFGPAEIPQIYLTTRESRHIKCRERLRLFDVLTERQRSDAVLRFRSNFDLKGMDGSDLSMCGFVEPGRLTNFTCDLPLGALQPLEIKNMLVIGKAYDCEHDALAMARMQPDLMTMGGVAAVAADYGEQHGFDLADLDGKALLPELEAAGILDKREGNRYVSEDSRRLGDEQALGPECESPDDIVELIKSGQEEVGDCVRLLEFGPLAAASLQRALHNTSGHIYRKIARMMAYIGEDEVHPVLLEYLDEILASGELPPLPDEQITQHKVPDHAWKPEPVYIMNTLARAGEKRLSDRMLALSRIISFSPRNLVPFFHYAYAIAFAGMRIPDPGIGEAAYQVISSSSQHTRNEVITDPRQAGDPETLRFDFVKMSLGRAMYRCGHPHGREILETYCRDLRICLARSAENELGSMENG